MKKWILVLVGILLIGIGGAMKSAYTTKVIEGNQTATTATGAVIGTATGAATGAAIGGVGIAACGTGVGIPVGLVCLGLATVFGTAGGVIGYSAGTPDTFETTLLYSPILSYTVMGIGILLIITATFIKSPQTGKDEVPQADKKSCEDSDNT